MDDKMTDNVSYPFSAIVGQSDLKKALILNLINPKIGGILIVGEKGTAKSTIVRALAKLTERKVLTLPLSVTEDRVVGAVDIEKTMLTGKTIFSPGILSEADGQILYIDEVNLLQDHITDILLCANASGENRVEREGTSAVYPCRFLMIGTMNPEEGELRQHFLDQFGMCVSVEAENEPNQRVLIVKSRMAFEENAEAFVKNYQREEETLKKKIFDAAGLLAEVRVTEADRLYIVHKCLEAKVQGHRGDLALEEAAKAVAAWNMRTTLTESDIDEAALFVLRHRRKKQEETQEQEEKEQQTEENQNQDEQEFSEKPEKRSPGKGGGTRNSSGEQGHGKEDTFRVGESFKVHDFGHQVSRQIQKGVGKRTNAKSASKMGRYIASTSQRKNDDLALDATIRAAAPYQIFREKHGLALAIKDQDIREKIRQRKYSNLLIFVTDASGSMGAGRRMEETKGAILSLLKDAYVKRDKVCLITFRGKEAQVLLPPTRSVERGVRLLEIMQVGGRTPLNAGLYKGVQVIRSELKKNPEILPYLIVITDGKGNVSLDAAKKPKDELFEISGQLREWKQLNTMVLDIEKKGAMSFGIAKEMAKRMGAEYQKIETLRSDGILNAVERLRNV